MSNSEGRTKTDNTRKLAEKEDDQSKRRLGESYSAGLRRKLKMEYKRQVING